MTGYQQLYANVGSRYNVAYLANGSGTIDANTVKEFRGLIEARPGVKVYDIKLLGRVMSVFIQAEVSAPMVRLLNEFVYAGGTSTANAIQFQLQNVFPLYTQSAPTAADVTANKTGAEYQKSPEVGGICYILGGDNGRFFGIPIPGCPTTDEGELEGVGSGIGKELAGVINPILIPALLLGGLYVFALGRIK